MTTPPLSTAARILPSILVAAGCGGVYVHPTAEANMQSTYHETGTNLRMPEERVGSGAPLVLIGGGLTGSASWQPHVERLAPERDVVRLQLISVQYGLADRPLPVDYSLPTESGALAAALDQLALNDPVDLVAWSYGAAVTLDFALSHPERVRTLTLIEPPAVWVLPDRGRALSDARELETLLPEALDDVTVETLKRFLHTTALVPPGTSPESMPQWESWVRHRRSLRNGSAVFKHSDDPSRLRAFTRPVLLVTGEGTSPFLRAVHDTLAATLPNSRTLELPGGHAPHLISLDRFLDVLARFQEAADRPPEPVRQVVTSRDGTPIAFWRSGTGSPLLLVHGATADHTTTWRFVLPELERRFTVYAMDRRGRGGSGDGPAYDTNREAEDVAAIVDAIGEPVSAVGHSYGALVALEAARRQQNLRRLILYEGVPLDGADLYGADAIARLERLREMGDAEGMLLVLFRDLVQLPPEEVELLRSQGDAWAARLRNAPTLPRELAAERSYVFEPQRFEHLRARILLLVGGDSPPREMENARRVAEGLPNARVVRLPGQQHGAMYAAPDLFVREVVRFLEES